MCHRPLSIMLETATRVPWLLPLPPPPPADVLPPGCGESSIDGASSVCRPAATDAIPVTSEALAVIRLPAPRAAAEMTTADDFNCFGPGVNNPRKLSSPVQESGWRGWETRSHRVKPIPQGSLTGASGGNAALAPEDNCPVSGLGLIAASRVIQLFS